MPPVLSENLHRPVSGCLASAPRTRRVGSARPTQSSRPYATRSPSPHPATSPVASCPSSASGFEGPDSPSTGCSTHSPHHGLRDALPGVFTVGRGTQNRKYSCGESPDRPAGARRALRTILSTAQVPHIESSQAKDFIRTRKQTNRGAPGLR